MLYKSNIFVGSNASCRFFGDSAIHLCHSSLCLPLSDCTFSVSLTPPPRPSSPSFCLLFSFIKWQKKQKQAKKKKKVAQRHLLTSHLLQLSFSFFACVLLSAQFPEPRESGLGETGGLSEDHSACVGASLWALVGGLASALLLAQHAL